MAKVTVLDVERAVPEGVHARLSEDELDAVLEVAWLGVAADGRLNDEEADAFVKVMLRLYGPKATPARIRKAMDHFAERVGRPRECRFDRCDRVSDVVHRLASPEARRVAYRLGYAMTMADLQTNDAEFAFDQAMRKALGLDDAAAEALVDEVSAAVLRES